MNADWLKSVKNQMDRVDALSLRERAIIFGGILAILFAVAYNLIFAPMRAEHDRLQKAVTAKFEQTTKLQAEVQRLSAQLVQDPDAANRVRLTEFKTQLAAAGEAVAAFTRGLVTPKEMARVVEQILSTNRLVRVVRVENLPPVSLLDPPQADPANPRPAGVAPAPAAGVGLYRHGLRIEVKGNYLDIVRVLRSMETLPWKVFWGEVSIKTEKYPTSHATLVIYTLNQDRAWLEI